MKKLLSICFLSIFLMMFGMQAQAQRDCCFQLSNPNADTLHGFANLPGGNLPLSHYMSPLVFGATDVYDMIFSDANCLGIAEGAKVSVELELWCDGENILDGQHDLSRYCNITLQTAYEELQWVGTPMLQENYSFVYEYPGAVPIFSGTYNISNVAFDYFYFRFLLNTQSRIVVTWNQIFRDVQLIVHIRERLNGTDNSLYWNSHVTESEYYQIGGHQSIRGRVLASDTLSSIIPVMKDSVVKDCEPVTVGMPAYTMDTTGIYNIAYVDTSCGYRIDSLIRFDYTHYVHPTTPTLSDSTITYCQRVTSDAIVLPAEPNPDLADHVADIVAYWSVDGATFEYAASFTPKTDTLAGTYTYYVKRHDNVTECESEVDTFQVVITPIPADPHVTDTLVEYCVGETPVALTYAAPAGQQVLWGEDVDNITSTTAPVPTATAAGTKVYYLKLQDTTTVNQCISDGYDSIKVKVYDNPTVTITTDNDTLCFGDKASMQANPATLTTYQWQIDGVDVADSTNATFSYTNNVIDTTTFHFMVKVTELHVAKSCNAADTIDVLAYPVIGAPTVVRGDTSICGPGTVTREVANGAHASISLWYSKDTTVVHTGTTYTHNFTETDTLYVSSMNDFGCETPMANWTRIIVRVDSIPVVTLTTDHVGDEVCAEENLIIRSSVASAKSPLTYAWTGTGLVAPLNRDSVTFNYAIAGVYTDTLTVTDANGCIGDATIDITVDTLPVIQKDLNYTVKNNDYCVGVNGKIEFTTPDYIKYSIDSAATWQTNKVFASLAAGDYYLVVEDGNGCKNHANHEVIVDAPIMPVLTLTDSANTRCEAPFNGKLIASVTPAATYNYQLLDGAFQADSIFSALKDSTYTVIVKDMTTGCRDTATHNVTNGRVTPVLTLVQNPNTHCIAPFGGSIAVTAMYPADSTYQYKLSTAPYLNYQDDTLFTGLEHGFYTVYARDVNSACVGSDTITVKSTSVLPTATISARPEICYGDTNLVSMVPGGLDVVFDHWTYSGPVPTSDPMVDTILHKQTFSMKGFPAGKHNFTAHFHDTVTHCTNTVTDTLRVIPVNIDLITIPYDAHVCSFDSLKVYCRYFPDDDRDTIVTYNWYAREYRYAGGFDTVWVSPTYNNRRVSIVVYDNHGCSNSKFVDLNVWPLPTLSINKDEQNYCQNATSNINVVASSTPSYTYWWKREGHEVGGNSPHLAINVGMADSVVTLTVKDGHNCYSYDTIPVHVITVPGHPNFDPATQYFCDNNVTIHYGTPAQAAPAVGTFTWLNGLDPEVERVSNTYSAYYVNTENSVSCYSDTTSVDVQITGAPVFNAVNTTYNSELVHSTSHARCYDAGATDNITITMNPAPSATLSYEYTLNSNTPTSTPIFNITRTAPGTYIDTIHIVATETHGTVTCTHDTTVYYTLTIHELPTAPSNFPHYFAELSDSTIFYCQGETAIYQFNDPLRSYEYRTYPSGTWSTTAPTTQVTSTGRYDVRVTRTDVTPNCSNIFRYRIYEVDRPSVLVTHKDASKLCDGDVFNDTIIAHITTWPFETWYKRVFVWNEGAEVVKTTPMLRDTFYNDHVTASDTVTLRTAFRVENGAQTITCFKTKTDSVIIYVQPRPTIPVMGSVFGKVDADSIAYCDGSTFTITSADFTTSAGASIYMVDGNITESAAIDAVYRVVAKNDLDPKCPSDTLYVKVHKKRTPTVPAEFAADKYNDTIYYCAGPGATANYIFTPGHADDQFTYYSGSSLLADKPTTDGTYRLHIADSKEGCSIDTTFVIKMVANPTALIVTPSAWVDSNVCEGTTINISYTFLITPVKTYTAIQSYSWTGVTTSSGAHATFNATPAADTSITFAYNLIDTVGNTGYGVACKYNYNDTITYTFFAKPAVPIYNGLTEFCLGDSIVVGVDSFSLTTANTELYTATSLPVTYKTSGVIKVQSQYTAFASCKSTENTITITGYNLPSVAASSNKAKICFEGDTATLTASGDPASYFWSTATIDTVAKTASIKVTDTVMYVVTGTDPHGCVSKDSVKVTYHPVFTVKLSDDTTVCVGDNVNISAIVTGTTGDFNLTWYKDSVATSSILFTDLGIHTDALTIHTVLPDSSAIVAGVPVPNKYMLAIEDANHCKMSAEKNIIRIAATNRPAFEFRMIDSTKTIRYMEVNSGDQAGFEMIIKQNCGNAAEKVFVDVQIYKNGVPMTDDELGEAMDNITSTYNTGYLFDVTYANAPGIYTAGVEACNFGTASYFFPNSEFINDNAYFFDWLYMHFLDGRKITVRTGAFKPGSAGVYTFSFAVIKASATAAANGLVYKYPLKVGGHSGHSGLTVKDTVAFDTFTIYVDSNYVGSSTSSSLDNPTVVTTSPEEPAVEKAINMNVYPNPASNNVNVVMSGVKGQTVITVHDMSGKAVTSMKVDIDDNNQIINLPVDNFSQGIYFIKAVNGSAVMTKKLIIAR